MIFSTKFNFGWILTFLAFVSVIFFPWPLTVLLVLADSFLVPLLPVAIGIFTDTLYYSSKTATLPLFTILGLVVTSIMFFVRSRLQTSTIRK